MSAKKMHMKTRTSAGQPPVTAMMRAGSRSCTVFITRKHLGTIVETSMVEWGRGFEPEVGHLPAHGHARRAFGRFSSECLVSFLSCQKF